MAKTKEITVYIVLDGSKASYDTGGLYHSTHATKEAALAAVGWASGYYSGNSDYYIEEEKLVIEY